ncbi:transposase [Nocardia pseudovaccinii]|uniref:transposase n=1 Tax=Nocardia pseudovaccinii TaxID=189540 RepID=UPI003D90BD00
MVDHCDDYDSEWAAIKAVSARLGMTAQTLHKWIRQSAVDAGETEGVSTESARAIREQERKIAELEQTKSSRLQRVSSCGTTTRDSGDRDRTRVVRTHASARQGAVQGHDRPKRESRLPKNQPSFKTSRQTSGAFGHM